MIDPMTASTAFATIVGLVCNYAAEQRSGVPDPYADFMESLRENHDEIRKKIEENIDLNKSLRCLLSQSNDVVLRKLEQLDQILAGVAANLDDFRPISLAVHKEEVLSDEAVGILSQFIDSGDARFLALTGLGEGGVTFLPMDTGAESITFEHRFLQDDLRTLCGLGFLGHDYNSTGETIFILTRQAERYVKAMRERMPQVDKIS